MDKLILGIWLIIASYFLYLFIGLAKKENNVSWPFATILLVFLLAGFLYFLAINNRLEGLSLGFGDTRLSINLRNYIEDAGSDIQKLVGESALPRPLSGTISDVTTAREVYRKGVLHEVLERLKPDSVSEPTHYAYIISLLIDKKDQSAFEAALKYANKYYDHKKEKHLLTPLVLEFIANNYLEKSDLNKAEEKYREALDLLKNLSSEYKSDKARIAGKIAFIFRKRNMNQKAIEYLKIANEYETKSTYKEQIQNLEIQPEIRVVYQNLEKALNEGNMDLLGSLYSSKYLKKNNVLKSLGVYFGKRNKFFNVSVISFDKGLNIVEVEFEATLGSDPKIYKDNNKLMKEDQNWKFF